jgi:two-component system response regulator (stage 0 sporulation protein F)
MSDDRTGCVLVIDDDENIRVLLERQIRRLGYDVIQATDGQSGLELARSERPQVILVDLRMPGIDGHTFLRRLTAAGVDASVVAMSGQGNMDDVIDVLRAGVIDYLRKPWSVAELAGAVERGFERRPVEARAQPTPPAPARPAPAPPATPPPAAAPAASRSGTQETFSQLLTRLRGGELPIPPIPSLVVSLRSSVQRPDVNLDELVALIEQDQRLTSDVLRLSNTAHYARGGRIHSIRVAVARIGLRQLHNLVETIFLREFFQARDPEIRQMLSSIWKRSVAHATAMRELAGAASGDRERLNGDTAYFIGLMADVGASLLLWLADERKATGASQASAASYLPGIQSVHQEVSAALLGQWMADAQVTAGVSDHHGTGSPAPTDYARMMVVAHDLTRQLPGLAADVTSAAPPAPALVDRCVAELHIDRNRLPLLAAAISERYRETVEVFGA